MLENILDTVFFKTIDESPKFRYDNIMTSIEYRSKLVDGLIKLYDLNLVREIYYQGISIKSYNGKKRSRLKKQEILLIKKIKIAEVSRSNLDEVLRTAAAYEKEFRIYFETKECSNLDSIYVKAILDNFYENYMIKLEELEETQIGKN